MSTGEAGGIPESEVLVRTEGPIATLTLNRPAQYNALSGSMLAEMMRILENINHNDGIQVVVIEAAGMAFCAGHDLREIRSTTDRIIHQALFDTCGRAMLTINRLAQPVIAKIQGIATAAGCQLVAACDLAIASQDAKFATSGINLGLFCSTPAVALSRSVGTKLALEMLLTGDWIDAETAAAAGLINRAVAADRLSEEVSELAHRIASKPAVALHTGKELFYRQLEMTLPEAYAYASRVMTDNMATSEAQEGIDAFLEKREPGWRTP